MLSLDLFDSRYEKTLHEGAVDDLEYRRIQDLNHRMDQLMKDFGQARSDAERAAIKRNYEELKNERASYFKVRTPEQQQPQPPAKGLLKNKDLITPQQRVAGATPAKSGMVGAVKDVVGGIKRFVKGEPDQGPTYEATIKKKDSDKNDEVQNLEVQRYLTKVRREHPAAYSDLEAISKHEIDNEKQTQADIDRLQKTLKTTQNKVTQDDQLDQAQSQLIKDLENQVNSLSTAVQGISAPVSTTPEPAPTTPAPAVATSVPTASPTTAAVAKEPAQVPSQMPEIPGQPEIEQPKTTQAKLPKKDKNILRRVRGIQKRLEKRVDQYADKKSADTAQKIQDLQAKLDAETAKLSDQGQDAAQQSGTVIDITDRLKAAGLDLPKTGTYNEAESPVIGSMVQQIEKQPSLTMSTKEIYDKNMRAFSDAYQKTRGTKLYYGGSVGVPLPFSDMDALVSVITAFPAEQKLKVWSQLFTDPNYLKGFLDQYVRQRGLIEGDVIPMAQQRQAPAQLKAYNLALQIMRAARDPSVAADKVDGMKQMLFKDFGTRIQRHPSGYYYITIQGRQVKLPDPETFSLEEHGGGIGPRQHWQDLMQETVTDVRAGMAEIYRRLAPKIERHRDSFLAGQLYDELENYAELHGAEGEFKRMMNGARNRAHMEYDTNPGGFQNWFWFLPFEDESLEEIDRRGFLKGLGATAGLAAMGGAKAATGADDPSWSKVGQPFDSSITTSQQVKQVSGQQPTVSSRIADVKGPNAKGEYLVTVIHDDDIVSNYVTKTPPKSWMRGTHKAYPQVEGMAESADDVKKRMSKLEALALAANRAGDDAKCKMYQQKIQSLKQKLSQSMAEGSQNFNKVEPYYVCLAGKPVKKFDYYQDARRFHDNWKQKLYREGNKAKADKVTLMPVIDEGIKKSAAATALAACMAAGGTLSGCATNPSVGGAIGTVRDVGTAAKTASTMTRAGVQDELSQELRNFIRAQGGDPGSQNLSLLYKLQKRLQGQKDSQPINEVKDTEAVEQAILKRIMVAHRDMLIKFGPEKIMTAASDVAYDVGDIGEIGSSDVSGWVKQVQQILGAVA